MSMGFSVGVCGDCGGCAVRLMVLRVLSGFVRFVYCASL